MADPTQVRLIKRGTAEWNKWRESNPEASVDLSEANLRGINLYFRADLRQANLEGVDFSQGNLDGAWFDNAKLVNASFVKTSLRKTTWSQADARSCRFNEACFHRAWLSDGDFRGADFSGADLSVRSASAAKLHGAMMNPLIYTRPNTPSAVDLGISTFDLAFADGLDQVHADSQSAVADYLTKAFEYLHVDSEERLELGPAYISRAAGRIRALIALYEAGPDAAGIVTVGTLLDAALIEHVRRHPGEIYRLRPRAFEELVAELLVSHGWQVSLTQETRDGGYDIFGVYKDSLGIRHTWIIECKRRQPDNPVEVSLVRALYGVKTDLRVGGALLATTSRFTEPAESFAASKYDLSLKGYEDILEWLNVYRPRADCHLHISQNRIKTEKQ